MWGWFKRRNLPSEELTAVAKKWLGPQALAVAVAESVKHHTEDVKAGHLSYPAHRRKDASVREIWRDLRLEALHRLFNFGLSDPFLLSDQRRQLELITCFLDERPHLEIPQPRGEVVADTLQAVWQVYVYLDSVGSEVADRQIDRMALRSAHRSILDRLESEAKNLRQQWRSFEDAIRTDQQALPNLPSTLIEAVYEDVTAKTKSIALSAIFGPYPESGMRHLEGVLKKEGGRSVRVARWSSQINGRKASGGFWRLTTMGQASHLPPQRGKVNDTRLSRGWC